MKLGGSGTAGRGLQTLFEGGAATALTDAQLLARFASHRGEASAEAAFAALVARHGPMVWGTCRRILLDPHAAEDAFQATFLILVRKAGSIRVEDSLGRWLHGVGVRVALRAKSSEARRRGKDLEAVEPVSTNPADPLDDLRAVIDQEVDRLPTSYRSVVVLCHLEGLTRERAASRLGCPVGTVNSRLSRASDLLRTRLARRGFAPGSAALAAWLASTEAKAGASIAVPPRLIESTARVVSGGLISSSVVVLWQATLRRMAMMTGMKFAALGSTLLALTALAVGPVGPEPRQDPQAQVADPKAAPAVVNARPATLSEQFRAIATEWEAAARARQEALRVAYEQKKPKAELAAIVARQAPEELAFFRRLLDLAARDPKNLGARDALTWVAFHGRPHILRNGTEPYIPPPPEYREAINLLLRDHPSDPLAIRAALGYVSQANSEHDELVKLFYEKAEGRSAKGVATLALAQYLEMKSSRADLAALQPVQPNVRGQRPDEQGQMKTVEMPRKPFTDAYWEHLRASDAGALRREADDLYRRLIDDYADVPYEGASPRPDMKTNLPPKTLGEIAQVHFNLSVGQRAPSINGIDLDAKRLQWDDYSGKVVLLAFWGGWSGPSMAAVPEQRKLVERFKGQPFAMLGLNTDGKAEVARKAVQAARMTWPSWLGLAPDQNPIARKYTVRDYPTFFVIDAKGMIRARQTTVEGLDKIIDPLIAEIEPKK